jgi:uroporphyrinogen-III synthase
MPRRRSPIQEHGQNLERFKELNSKAIGLPEGDPRREALERELEELGRKIRAFNGAL